MGDEYERAEALADEYSTMTPAEQAKMRAAYGAPEDGADFDTPDEFDSAGAQQAGAVDGKRAKVDPMRPEAKRGRYTLPNPANGKSKSWQRVTNFVKLTDDTYHLELWKQRNVLKGVALMAAERPQAFLDGIAASDVKRDKDRMNNIASAAQDAAEAYKMADEGTALHTSTELCDYAGGDLSVVPQRHRPKVRMYRDALAAHGIGIVPDMIERVTASDRYEVAGKFDRVYRLGDGSHVIGDLKTGDSLDLSFPSIAAQLECYVDGVNNVGVFDGQRYDTTLKVRDDFGLVVHLPSTRDEVTVYRVDLAQGRLINEGNLTVRNTRKIKARHVATAFNGAHYQGDAGALETHAYWLEQMNAVHTYAELVDVAARAKSFGQWNERLGGQARLIAGELSQSDLKV